MQHLEKQKAPLTRHNAEHNPQNKTLMLTKMVNTTPMSLNQT